MTSITLKLIRIAKSKGGDRYEGYLPEVLSGVEDKPLVIYLPQIISRSDGKKIAKSFKMTLEEG